MRQDELSCEMRLERRTTRNSSSRRITRISVSVVILETHNYDDRNDFLAAKILFFCKMSDERHESEHSDRELSYDRILANCPVQKKFS